LARVVGAAVIGSALEFIKLVEAVGDAVAEFPELAHSVASVFGAYAQKKDPTHAMRQVKGQAALAYLGIKDPK
jgi:hypothetical protein